MKAADKSLATALARREAENRLRSLNSNQYAVDFCSNDYLGLARSEDLRTKIAQELSQYNGYKTGSTGSRLLSGNTRYAEELEQQIADFHHAEAGLVFNSGYDANVGLFSCIAGRHDTILYDELSHASIIDGLRLSLALSFRFDHNNPNDLEEKLKKAKGNIFVAVESVYSMDGDFAPLTELVALCEKYNANLIVDEAHATGIYGQQGRGRVCELELEGKVFARIHTFGKALGAHGGIISGSVILRKYLINFARPFIYSTALPFHSLVSIHCAYDVMKEAENERKKLSDLINHFNEKSFSFFSSDKERMPVQSPIQKIVIPGNKEVKAVAAHLQQHGFDIRPVLSPTVPEGKERIRICLHAYNSEEEIDQLFKLLFDVMPSRTEKAGEKIHE